MTYSSHVMYYYPLQNAMKAEPIIATSDAQQDVYLSLTVLRNLLTVEQHTYTVWGQKYSNSEITAEFFSTSCRYMATSQPLQVCPLNLL